MRLTTLFKHWSYRIFAPGTMLREQYEALKQLLQHDIACHEQMAEIQEVLHGTHPEDITALRKRFARFSFEVTGMIAALEKMDPGSYASLKSYHRKFDFYTQFLLAPPKLKYSQPFTCLLAECAHAADRKIGGKALNLSIIARQFGFNIPRGFVVTTDGYHYFIEYNDLRPAIDRLLERLDIHSEDALRVISGQLMALVRQAVIPPLMEEEILATFDRCFAESPGVFVAVRSSAIGEDGAYSFAGQYLSLLDQGKQDVCNAWLQVIASKYSPEALYYRISYGLGDEETAMSVLVQEMVAARSSGVIYSRKPDGNDNHAVYIQAVQGGGAPLVAGEAIAETYTLTRALPPVPISAPVGGGMLHEAQAINLAAQAMVIEQHFNRSQDIEWAVDAEGNICILQARPLSLLTSAGNLAQQKRPSDIAGPVLYQGGVSASPGRASGQVVLSAKDLRDATLADKGVLVTRDTPPELARILHRLAAVVAERGSRACHFATVAREFGIPFIAEARDAHTVLERGMRVTVDSSQCVVYQGAVASEHRTTHPRPLIRSMREAAKFITPLELVDPSAKNFTPEGCRSMHDIIRFCHEKGMHAMFSHARPGTGYGALRLEGNIPLDVFLFDVGDGFAPSAQRLKTIPLNEVVSLPFQALWRGLSHPSVQWKQKPFDWAAYDRIEMAGGVPPKRESFAFASYAVVGYDYLHFNIRFGYHFTIVDILCGENTSENYCMLRFAGGGGNFDQRLLRIGFITGVLERLGFAVEQKADLLEAKISRIEATTMMEKLDMLGRLLGATKLMDMVLDDANTAAAYVDEFFAGRYSFSEQG